jgi:epoxyqueuosine reductase
MFESDSWYATRALCGHDSGVTIAELERLAEELGIDVVGAGPAEPYAETERHIRERRQRGLFADMRFTMARPEVSCHPEALLPNAKTVISAALCYYVEEAAKPPVRDAASPHRGPVEGVWGNREVPPAELRGPLGRLPRYTWFDGYADLREKLDALGRRLGGAYRVLVDENDHVDREGAVRAGIGFYGKNTMLITRRHGSWVVLGTLVTDVEVEPSPRLALDCGSCTLCIEACPTGALDEPGVLDSTRCLSYWTQAPAPIPEEYRAELGSQVYGCDICQDVCPWNRGIEKRRAGAVPARDPEPHVSLVDWLEASDEELRDRYERLYFPRKDPRYLRRNALVALGNSGDPQHATAAEPYAEDGDPLLREHAEWALAQLSDGKPRE